MIVCYNHNSVVILVSSVPPWCPHLLSDSLAKQGLLQSCREPAADLLSGHSQAKLLSPDLSDVL